MCLPLWLQRKNSKGRAQLLMINLAKENKVDKSIRNPSRALEEFQRRTEVSRTPRQKA